MKDASKERVQQYFKSINDRFQSDIQSITALTTYLTQYKEASDDLVRAKIRYVELIEKYALSQEVRPGSVSSFPGLVSATPRYMSSEMKGDTAEVQSLGDLITELEGQVDLLYSQIRQTMGTVISTSSDFVDSITQINKYLTEQIESSSNNGVYGSGKLQQNLFQ
jgi:hypothetical protein